MTKTPQPPPDDDSHRAEGVPEEGPAADAGSGEGHGHTGVGADSVVPHLRQNQPPLPER